MLRGPGPIYTDATFNIDNNLKEVSLSLNIYICVCIYVYTYAPICI